LSYFIVYFAERDRVQRSHSMTNSQLSQTSAGNSISSCINACWMRKSNTVQNFRVIVFVHTEKLNLKQVPHLKV